MAFNFNNLDWKYVEVRRNKTRYFAIFFSFTFPSLVRKSQYLVIYSRVIIAEDVIFVQS